MRAKSKSAVFTRTLIMVILAVTAFMFCLPIIFTVTNSFMLPQQISGSSQNVSSAVNAATYKQGMAFIPFPVSLNQYFDILIRYYNYLYMFWQSIKIAVIITLAHVVVSVVTGYLFGRYSFPLKNVIFAIYVGVLFLPFSVTLLPNYLLVKWLNIFNTHWAIILPAIFTPLGTILMTMFVKEIPPEYFEAASLETNSYFVILRKILLPLLTPAIGALVTLTFAEAWNMVEQPQVLIENPLIQPLSIALNGIYGKYTTARFAGAVIYLAPVVFLFFFFEDTIMEEIGLLGGANEIEVKA